MDETRFSTDHNRLRHGRKEPIAPLRLKNALVQEFLFLAEGCRDIRRNVGLGGFGRHEGLQTLCEWVWIIEETD